MRRSLTALGIVERLSLTRLNLKVTELEYRNVKDYAHSKGDESRRWSQGTVQDLRVEEEHSEQGEDGKLIGEDVE